MNKVPSENETIDIKIIEFLCFAEKQLVSFLELHQSMNWCLIIILRYFSLLENLI